MTFVSRKATRDALVATIKTIAGLTDDADGTVHVVPYFTKDPAGISPFCCVDSGSVQYDLSGDPTKQTSMQFVIGFWVRRDDPAGAEDMLDGLALALAQRLSEAYYQPRFYSPSVSDFEEIAGIQYKFELHFVEIDS
jgi:hypothetical protein